MPVSFVNRDASATSRTWLPPTESPMNVIFCPPYLLFNAFAFGTAGGLMAAADVAVASLRVPAVATLIETSTANTTASPVTTISTRYFTCLTSFLWILGLTERDRPHVARTLTLLDVLEKRRRPGAPPFRHRPSCRFSTPGATQCVRRGSETRNEAPPPGRSSTHAFPPCSAANWATRARPIPAPGTSDVPLNSPDSYAKITACTQRSSSVSPCGPCS